MSRPPPPESAAPTRDLPTSALRNLDEIYAGVSAAEVLSLVPWEGVALDPATTPAAEFLAVL